MKKKSTLERLEAAFQRLKDGTPLLVDTKRKVNPASVEDEAGVARSTLRNTAAYSELFDRINIYKNSPKTPANPLGSGDNSRTKLSSKNPDITELKTKLKDKQRQLDESKELINFLVAANAELTALLTEKVITEKLNEFLEKQTVISRI